MSQFSPTYPGIQVRNEPLFIPRRVEAPNVDKPRSGDFAKLIPQNPITKQAFSDVVKLVSSKPSVFDVSSIAFIALVFLILYDHLLFRFFHFRSLMPIYSSFPI